MKSSTFDPIIAMTYPLALPHKKENGDIRVSHKMTRNSAGHPSSFAYSSVLDLSKVATVLLNNKLGDHQFLSETSLNEIKNIIGKRYERNHSHPWARIYQGHSIGFMIVEYREIQVIRHGGTNLSFDCRLNLFYDQNVGIITMINFYQGSILSEIIMDIYDDTLSISKQIPRFKNKVSYGKLFTINPIIFQGTYLNVESGQLLVIEVDKDILKLKMGTKTKNLKREKFFEYSSEEYFESLGKILFIPIKFLMNEFDEVDFLIYGGVPYEIWKSVPYQQLSLGNFQQFEGNFKDPYNYNNYEIISIISEENAFIICEGETKRSKMRLISPDIFTSNFGIVKFAKNSKDENYIQIGRSALYFKK